MPFSSKAQQGYLDCKDGLSDDMNPDLQQVIDEFFAHEETLSERLKQFRERVVARKRYYVELFRGNRFCSQCAAHDYRYSFRWKMRERARFSDGHIEEPLEFSSKWGTWTANAVSVIMRRDKNLLCMGCYQMMLARTQKNCRNW